jgi:hypothetical protein
MTSGELIRLFRAAGFKGVWLLGDTQDRTFIPGSPRLLLVASKS